MEGNQKDEDGKDMNQEKDPHTGGIPDLAITMQSMNLADPGLCRVTSSQVIQQAELDFSFCLIMKVACTGGTPRSISHQALERAMMRAWKNIFYAISQVSNTVFMAHFRSQEDMISVYTRQPWVANSENLLIDWFDPNDNANSSSDYRFDHILVTVRAYGIPRNRRSISLLTNILNQVGVASEFHILQESNLFARQDYIWGTTKLMVNSPVKDRAMVTYADNTVGLAYLHYEKIKRICLFCGIMFHNVQNCSIRNSLISERSKNRQSGMDIPTHRFGQWVIDENFVPVEVIQSTRMGDQGNNQRGNAILSRLQRLFSEDPKGKGKIADATEKHMNKTNINIQGHFQPQYIAANIDQSSTLMQNRLPSCHVNVHPSFGRPENNLQLNTMHDQQLIHSQPMNQQRNIEEAPNIRGEEATQTHAIVLQTTEFRSPHTGSTVVCAKRAMDSNAETQLLLPAEASNIMPRPVLVQHNNPLLQPQSGGTNVTDQNTQQFQLPTTTSPLQISMDLGMQVTPVGISNPPLTAHQSQLLQNPSPKRPLPSPSPNLPPLAKKASPWSEFDPAGGSLQPPQQILPGDSPHQPPPLPIGSLPLSPHHSITDRHVLHVAGHLDTDEAIRVGILGAGPAAAGGGTILGGGGVGGEASRTRDLIGPIFGADSSTPDSRSRRRPSGWDIQDSTQIGAQNPSTMGVTVYQHGSASWRRVGDANEIGQGGPHRRIRGVSLGRNVHPYAISPRRSPARTSSATTGDHNPWPLQHSSPTSSAGTQDSRYGAFSTPQMIGHNYMSRDVAAGTPDRGGQEIVVAQDETGTTLGESQAAEKQKFQQDTTTTMEFDLQAMAPASKAPHAP